MIVISYSAFIMPWWAEPAGGIWQSSCVCVCHSARYCSHFLHHRWKLRTEMCNASLTQCYLEIELMNFGLETLLLSYGMICSPWQLLPAVQSPAKNKSLTTGWLSTWQFNLYNKSDGNQSEIQRTRLPKLHCLPQHITDHVQLKVQPNFGTHPCLIVLWYFLVLFFVYTNSCLAAL